MKWGYHTSDKCGKINLHKEVRSGGSCLISDENLGKWITQLIFFKCLQYPEENVGGIY